VPPKFPNVDVALKMHATKGSPQGEFSDDGKGEIEKFPVPHQYLDPQKIFSILQQSKLGGVSSFEKHASIPFFTILQNIDRCPLVIWWREIFSCLFY